MTYIPTEKDIQEAEDFANNQPRRYTYKRVEDLDVYTTVPLLIQQLSQYNNDSYDIEYETDYDDYRRYYIQQRVLETDEEYEARKLKLKENFLKVKAHKYATYVDLIKEFEATDKNHEHPKN